MAIGARCSDHPALIGAGAPRIAELGTAAKAGVDLRPFGRRREDACTTLFSRALELADQHGTLRDPSVESLASLVLIEGLIDTTDVYHTEARPFVNAYTSHAKILLEAGAGTTHSDAIAQTSVANTVLGWTAFLRDALTAANQGRAPAFSDDDLFLLTKDGSETPLPLRILLDNAEPSLAPEVDPVNSFWQVFQSILHTIANLARQVPAHLTGVRARRTERIDEDFANYFLAEATYLFEALPEMNRRCDLARAVRPDLYESADIGTLVRTVSFSSCSLSWMLNRIVGQRLAGRHPETASSLTADGGPLRNSSGEPVNPWPALPGPSNDEAYWQRLFGLRRRVYIQAFRASRKVAGLIGQTIAEGYSLSSAWLDPRFVQVLFSRLPFWASSIVNMPTVEQGGPHLDFTFSDKLQDLEAVKKGCFSVGWMSAAQASGADWIKLEIAKTEEAQAAHWERRTSRAAPLVEVSAPSPEHMQADAGGFEAFLAGWTAEQLAQAGMLPAARQDVPEYHQRLPVHGSPSGTITSWPASGLPTSSAGTSNPASPPSAPGSSPSSGAGASPPGSGLPSFAGQEPRDLSAADMQALFGPYPVPPPLPAAAPLLGLPAHAAAPPPLSAFGLPPGAPLPSPDVWQPAHGASAGWPPAGPGAGQAPSPKYQGNLIPGVDWDELLGTTGAGDEFGGAWGMMSGEGSDPFAAFGGGPASGAAGAGGGYAGGGA